MAGIAQSLDSAIDRYDDKSDIINVPDKWELLKDESEEHYNVEDIDRVLMAQIHLQTGGGFIGRKRYLTGELDNEPEVQLIAKFRHIVTNTLKPLPISSTDPIDTKDASDKPVCSADGCHRRESCGPFCRDNGNL